MSIVNNYYKKAPEEPSEDDNGESHQEKKDFEYAIITPYEGQRNFIIEMFKKEGVEQQVFNLDSFQVRYCLTACTYTCSEGNIRN